MSQDSAVSIFNRADPSNPLIPITFTNSIQLTTTNYFSWKTQIQALLIGYDLQKFIDGTHPPPPPTISLNNSQTPNPAYLTWIRQDRLLFGALIGTLSPNIVPLVEQSKTSQEAWNILADNLRMYRPHPRSELVQRNYELMTVGMDSLVLRNDGPSTLPELLQEINNWIVATGFPKGTRMLGSASQRELVMNYFSNFGGESSFSSRMVQKLCLHRDWPARLLPAKYESICKLVRSFFEELSELFRVPEPQELSHTKNPLGRKQRITSFICFLLQLLNLDSNPSRFPFVDDLKFLVTILGDTPFQATEHNQVQSLLEQFEKGANQVGPLVHSLIFFHGDLEKIRDKFEGFTRNIQVLYDNIGNTIDLLPRIINPEANLASDSLVILNPLLRDLEDLMNQGNDACVDLKDQARKLHETLVLCCSYISTQQQYSGIRNLTGPVAQLRDLAYEADYLLKTYTAGDAPLWYVTTRFTHLSQTIVLIGAELEDAKANYEFAASEAQTFSSPLNRHPQKDDDYIDVFDEKKWLILYQLTQGPSRLEIIFISGIPGVGKTSLATEVFNDSRTLHHFDKLSWHVVSQVYHVKTLLSSILINMRIDLDETAIHNMEEGEIRTYIHKSLFGRRYLIVLDNIWSSDVWDDIRRLFPDNRNGSRVLFTSRDKNAAPPDSWIHELSQWSDSQSWELLERKIFHTNSCPEELLEFGHEIARKCYGLPLAVVVIAGVLSRMRANRDAWEKTEESLPDFPESVMQILKLSYSFLPQELKPCYLYFTVFQEETVISVKKLLHLWIAEGFILPESSESMAKRYLQELIDKNLVIVAKRGVDGGVKACLIHDLLREMCLKISKDENFVAVLDHDSLIWNQKFPSVRVHVNPSGSRQSLCGEYELPHGQCIRSIFGSLPDIPKILVKMKLLRVLCCRTKFKDLFGIELLVYLRYLILDDMVPSIESLKNLEFLIVNSDSVRITSDILKMTKLKYLRFQKALFAEDCSISQPNNLEFLSCVAIHSQKDVELLKYSPHLRRLKCEYLPSWKEGGEHRCLDLSFFTLLESLTIRAELFNAPIVGIEFPKSIRKLSLIGFGLPWEKMSLIGVLPSLMCLKLGKDAFVGPEWFPEEGDFIHLKFLKLNGLSLSRWNADKSHFPRLQQLVIENCPNLESIPTEIGDIDTLQSIHIEGDYAMSLVDSAQEIQQEQRDFGNEDLSVEYPHETKYE